MTPLELDKDSFAHKPAEEGLGVGWHSSGHFGWLGEVSSLKFIKILLQYGACLITSMCRININKIKKYNYPIKMTKAN